MKTADLAQALRLARTLSTWRTAREVGEEMGVSREAAKRWLYALVAAGEVLAALDDVLHRTLYRAMGIARRAAEKAKKKPATPGTPKRDSHGRFVGQSRRKKQ